MGECTLSVMVITFAFLSFANSSAFRVRMEYLGKPIPMTASSLPTRSICSNTSLRLVVFNNTIPPRTMFR